MGSRSGLAGETCTRELAQEMAGVPALAEAFKDSYAVWAHFPAITFGNALLGVPGKTKPPLWCVAPHVRGMQDIDDGDGNVVVPADVVIPAPTVRKMLKWLKQWDKFGDSMTLPRASNINWQVRQSGHDHDITNPDALARACIEVSKVRQ